jgi:hypothetical protein
LYSWRIEKFSALTIFCQKQQFATEKVGEQLSLFGDGKEVPDTIWYGYVQGMDDEWNFCS